MASLFSPSLTLTLTLPPPPSSPSLKPSLLPLNASRHRPLRLPPPLVAFASPATGVQTKDDDLSRKLEQSIASAQEVCAENDASAECIVAWEEVEEISAAKAHKRVQDKGVSDALEAFCKDNPETDECRIYED